MNEKKDNVRSEFSVMIVWTRTNNEFVSSGTEDGKIETLEWIVIIQHSYKTIHLLSSMKIARSKKQL